MKDKFEFIESALQEFYVKQFYDAYQNVFTPFGLCRRMIDKASDFSGISLVVNPELAFVLINFYQIKPDSIVGFVDHSRKSVLYKEMGITKFAKLDSARKHIYFYDINGSELKNVIFNNIFGNPAYDKNFHLKMLKIVIDKLDNDGTCVWIHPARWAQDPLAPYKNNVDLKKYENLPWSDFEVIPVEEANEIFQIGIPSDLIISVLNHKSYKSPRSLINKFDESIVKKLIKYKSKLNDRVDRLKEDGIRVKLREIINLPGGFHGQKANEDSVSLTLYKHDQIFIDGFTKNGISWKDIGNKNGQQKSSIPWSIKFNTYNEAENFSNSLKTLVYMGLVAIVKRNSHVPFKFLPYFDDYNKPIDNDVIIKLLDLNNEETSYIYKIAERYVTNK